VVLCTGCFLPFPLLSSGVLFAPSFAHSPCSRLNAFFPHIQPLSIGTPYIRLRLSTNQTSDLHPKEQGLALVWSTPLLHSSTTYLLPLPFRPSPVDTPVHTRRSVRPEPLQISRNIPLDPSNPSRLLHTGWRNPSIILSRHPLTGSVPVEDLPYVNRRRTLPSLLKELASLSARATYRLLSLRAIDFCTHVACRLVFAMRSA
jgi:hypothetical protein